MLCVTSPGGGEEEALEARMQLEPNVTFHPFMCPIGRRQSKEVLTVSPVEHLHNIWRNTTWWIKVSDLLVHVDRSTSLDHCIYGGVELQWFPLDLEPTDICVWKGNDPNFSAWQGSWCSISWSQTKIIGVMLLCIVTILSFILGSYSGLWIIHKQMKFISLRWKERCWFSSWYLKIVHPGGAITEYCQHTQYF